MGKVVEIDPKDAKAIEGIKNEVAEEVKEDIERIKREEDGPPEDVGPHHVERNESESKKEKAVKLNDENILLMAEGAIDIPKNLPRKHADKIRKLRKAMPRNIQCKGLFTWHPKFEMSHDYKGYSFSYLKKKGLI